MKEFRSHGVYQFVLHPRIGLPHDCGWMSPQLLGFMRVAIEEAARTGMRVILYDEGMYPSGSSSGQVVAENPAYACRGLTACVLIETDSDASQALAALPPEADARLVAIAPRRDGSRIAVICSKVSSVIRGLHYREELADDVRHDDIFDETPPAADLLNPDAMHCFFRLVHERFYHEFGSHFGHTIFALFTDEPSLLGRLHGPVHGCQAQPGTNDIATHLHRLLGYDFTPHWAALWFDDETDALLHRSRYYNAIFRRLEETFYKPMSDWCASHGVSLTGHPHGPSDLGLMRHFQIPGQDVVWRWVEPWKTSGLEGAESTSAKAASSAMIHQHRRRNLNEFAGAFGATLTFEEFRALAGWLLVRGCNLLVPHAFLYSMRGPRRTERPPDVGLHSPWWNQFKPFADACQRLCWLNTDSGHVCDVAIYAAEDHAPWLAAKSLFRHQLDFNYLSPRDLASAKICNESIELASMRYRTLVIENGHEEPDKSLIGTFGGIVRWPSGAGDENSFIAEIRKNSTIPIALETGSHDVRLRQLVKADRRWLILFNEGAGTAKITKPGSAVWNEQFDPETGQSRPFSGDALELAPWELTVLAQTL